MALDLLAGSVVFQIPHKPNAKLNIRMGFHRLGYIDTPLLKAI